MSAAEKSLQNFLLRWSCRKLAVAQRGGQAPEALAEEGESAEPPALAEALPRDPAAPAFDPASLPPIESINAASDIRPFLLPGVPTELTRAALRRAWVSDPTIRDFIGLAENQWDFTKPDSVPGFGALDLTPELRRMVAGLFGDAAADEARNTGAGVPVSADTAENSATTAPSDHAATSLPDAAAANPVAMPQTLRQAEKQNAAVQDDSADGEPNRAAARSRHGGALPK